jgi:hypothetical protein
MMTITILGMLKKKMGYNARLTSFSPAYGFPQVHFSAE